jgi:hypothetical protein
VTSTAIDTTGATIIVIVANGLLASPISDSQTNTNYFRCAQSPSTAGYGNNIYVIVNPITNASHTFTYGALTNNFPAIAVLAFSGSFGGMELTTVNHNASTQTLAPGSITPSSDNALLVTGYADGTTSGTRSIGGGFTIADQVSGNANSSTIATAYLIQTSAAAANPTWSTTAAASDTTVCMVSFLLRPAGGTTAGGSYGFA